MKTSARMEKPAARADFERLRNALRSDLTSAPSAESVRAFERLERELDACVREAKPALVGSGLFWNPDDRGLSEWIYMQHLELAELARRAADLFERRETFAGPNTLRMTGLAFLHWGEAAKWIVGRRDRPSYGWMHWLMTRAIQAGCSAHPCEVRLDGRARTAPLESLYLRTLILDRFAGGNLSRPQSEVLDAWLWEWMPDIRGAQSWPGGAVFRADLDGNAGLRRGRRADEGPALYLAIAPLEARRRAVIKEFHQGRIVPSTGLTADFRIEEHVAVLEQLRVAFESAQEQDSEREARKPVAGQPVEVCVGLSEILLRGLGTHAAPEVSDALKSAKASLSDTQRLRQVQFASEFEASRRFLRLIDVSFGGYGFEATEQEAANIAVDDVVSMRLSETPVLGRVTRRTPGPARGTVILGVQAMSLHPRAIVLTRTEPRNRPDDEEAFIFVAGMDPSGAQDSFLVPEKMVHDSETRVARIAGQKFTIGFNRVRRKGRGWAMVGFEIVAARPVAPEDKVPLQ